MANTRNDDNAKVALLTTVTVPSLSRAKLSPEQMVRVADAIEKLTKLTYTLVSNDLGNQPDEPKSPRPSSK